MIFKVPSQAKPFCNSTVPLEGAEFPKAPREVVTFP